MVFSYLARMCISLSSLQVVKPLLQERTRKKVHVLSGCGRDELLKVYTYMHLISYDLAV